MTGKKPRVPKRPPSTRPSADRSYPSSLEGAAEALRLLDAEAEGGTHSAVRIIEAAAGLGDRSPQRIISFILTHVLPRCVGEFSADPVTRNARGRIRQILSAWLRDLPESVMWRVRREVIAQLAGALKAHPSTDCLYCLAAIGYRSPTTIEAFRQQGMRGDTLGHEALRLLLGLTPDDTTRRWVRARIVETQFEERSDELLNAAAHLHDPSLLDWLVDDSIRRGPGWFALSRLTWSGERVPGDRQLQDRVWKAVMRVVDAWPDGVQHLLAVGGLVRRCRSPEPIASLVQLVPRLAAESPAHVFRLLDSVAEGESLVHLRGWSSVPSVALVAVLRPAIETDTGNTGIGQTSESLSKDRALDALLASGSLETRSVLETAIDQETNAYVRAELMRTLAACGVTAIRGWAGHFLESNNGFQRDGTDNERMVLYLAAARLAASVPSLHALELLLRSNGCVDGHPLTVPVDEAVEQALWLGRTSEHEVSRTLLGASAGSTMAQTVAAIALGHLPSSIESPAAWTVLHDMASNSVTPSYVRTAALQSLMRIRGDRSADALKALCRSMCTDQDHRVQYAAIAALLSLPGSPSDRALAERYALQRDDSGDSRMLRARVVGQLASTGSIKFSERAAQLIAKGNDDTIFAVVDGLQQSSDKRRRVRAIVIDAITRRIVHDENELNARPPLLVALAALRPHRLLSEKWESVWHRWMPDTRVALAEQIPTATGSARVREKRAEYLLLLLSGDGVFAVRRAACKALSRLRPDALAAWCRKASVSGSIRLRSLAAESAGWLPPDSPLTLDNDLLRLAEVDDERSVRDASERSRKELRRRLWAQELITEIRRGAQNYADGALRGYRFSRALERIGDDGALDELEAVAAESHPPHIRYWLRRTADELAKQWQRTTSKWPEPWAPWRGTIEHASGQLRVGDREYRLDLHLWHDRGKGADGFSAWGGSASLPSPTEALSVMTGEEKATVSIDGRQAVAHALIAGVRDRHVTLIGTGPYPSR